MGRCCCGKYDATQEEDFLMNDTQHQMLGKSQSYVPFCGPMKDHRIYCLEATIAEKEDQITSLEGDNEILRNMNKILKDSVEALAAGRDRLRKVGERIVDLGYPFEFLIEALRGEEVEER